MTAPFATRFVRGVVGVGSATFIQIVLGFVAFLVVARWLPDQQFGAFVLLQVTSLFFVAVADVLLQKMAITHLLIAEPDASQSPLVNTAISYKLVIGAAIGMTIWVLIPLSKPLFHSGPLSALAPYLPLLFFLSSLDELLFAVLQGMHRYREIALAQVLTGASRLCLVTILIVFMRMDVFGVVYAFLISLIVSIALQWFWVGIRPRLSLDRAMYRRLFQFGFPLGLNNVLTFFFAKCDRFLLGAMVGPGGVALYEVAARIPDSIQRLYQAFQSVFFPSMSELFSLGRRQAAERVLNNSIRVLSFVTLSAALCVLLFRDGLTYLLFSHQYSGSAVAFSLLMISLNMAISGNLMGTALVAGGRSDLPIRISVVMAGVSLFCNLLFIPKVGFVGAAWAALTANYVTNLSTSVWYLRKEGINIWWREFLKPILLFAVYAACIVAAKPERIDLRIGLLCLFVLLGVVLKIVSRRDLDLLLPLLRSPGRLAAPPSQSSGRCESL